MELKSVGLHGSKGLPERQVHEKKRSGFEGRKKTTQYWRGFRMNYFLLVSPKR